MHPDEIPRVRAAIAEAIIEDLQSHGYPLIHQNEIDARVQALAGDNDVEDIAEVKCNRCRAVVFTLNVAANPMIKVSTLTEGLRAHLETCP